MKAIVALCIGLISTVNAATIAVIDSGMDPTHKMIVPNLWTNPQQLSVKGPYTGVVHGWNFVERNGQIIDMTLIETFSPDVKKFYDLRAQAFLFSVSDADKAWMREVVKDKAFVNELNRFGTYVHGTHVAGIAIKSSQNKAMGIKLLKTEAKSVIENQKALAPSTDPWKTIEGIMNSLAIRQVSTMVEISQFMKEHKVDVANGSFGTGYDQALGLAEMVVARTLGRLGTEEEHNRAAKMLMDSLVRVGATFATAAPDTFFVFAAGNDSRNNDEFGFSPANVKADNTISVAATYEDQFLAPFSNWGVQMVEVAAPGMMIHSAIPGNEFLRVSGTSQAAPFVANVAGKVKDTNPRLRPAQIKRILMETVEKKSFLTIRVKTGGIVSAERAVLAAQLSRTLPLTEAIERANLQLPQKASKKSFGIVSIPVDVEPIPMPSLFE